MPTAKSYDNYKVLGEPYEENGKMYVRVRGACTRCGGSGHYSYNQMDGTRCYGCNGSGQNTLKVRWYTPGQRASMDRAAEKRAEQAKERAEARAIKCAARNAFGFGEAGYITLYYGDQNEISDWFKSNVNSEGKKFAWYNTIFHWYTPSNMPVPEDLPDTITPVTLNWDTVKINDLEMRDNDEVSALVNTLIIPASPSTYQGTVGEWINPLTVTIVKRVDLEGSYGTSYMHIMEDADKNVYVWKSSSKCLEENTTYTMKAKVKEHQEYRNVKQTVVWYCRLISK